MSDPVTGLVDLVKESWAEAKAEAARRNKLLSQWCKWFDGLKYSPRKFYADVAQRINECKIPDLEPEIILLKQGGIFSLERQYLRFRRDRLVFEICAAPFARGFFISERLFDRRREAGLLHLLLFYAGTLMIFVLVTLTLGVPLVARFGFGLGVLWTFIIIGGLIAVALTLVRLGGQGFVRWMERNVPEIPFFGPIYEYFFQPNTYFREDTNACYRVVVHQMLMDTIDELTKEHGLRPLTEEERRPRLGDR